jgi:hypothetical protein
MTARVRGVYFDKDFKFLDGETGEKLFVVVADRGGEYLAAKTTSQQHTKSANQGCNLGDYFQNYFLPAGVAEFRKPTWIDLQSLYAFRKTALDVAVTAGLAKLVILLPKDICSSLIDCAVQADGTTAPQVVSLEHSKAEHCA